MSDTVILYCRACRYETEHEPTYDTETDPDHEDPIYVCNDCGEER